MSREESQLKDDINNLIDAAQLSIMDAMARLHDAKELSDYFDDAGVLSNKLGDEWKSLGLTDSRLGRIRSGRE